MSTLRQTGFKEGGRLTMCNRLFGVSMLLLAVGCAPHIVVTPVGTPITLKTKLSCYNGGRFNPYIGGLCAKDVLENLRSSSFPNLVASGHELAVDVYFVEASADFWGATKARISLFVKLPDGTTIHEYEAVGRATGLYADLNSSVRVAVSGAIEDIKLELVRDQAEILGAARQGPRDRQLAQAPSNGSAEAPAAVSAPDPLTEGLQRAAAIQDAIAAIVGMAAYKQAPRAEYAAADARAMKEYLTAAFGYQEGNIIFLQDPTKGQLEEVFGSAGNPRGKLYNWVKPGKSDVFVYYAGHGAPSVSDKKGYLVPVDASPDYVSASGYPLDLLYANLAKIPAKSIAVVLDACFSGLAADTGGRSTMLLKDASPLVVAPVSENVPSKLSVFAAATGSQLASWYPDKGHSLFTYWFLSGLKGEADADKDGSITLGEMKAYLSENVTYTARRLYGRDQTPEVKGRPDAELLRLR
jgi:hypothetical protein